MGQLGELLDADPVWRNVSTAAKVQNARSSSPDRSRRLPVSGSSAQIRAASTVEVAVRRNVAPPAGNDPPGVVACAAARLAAVVVRASLTRDTSPGRTGSRSRVR